MYKHSPISTKSHDHLLEQDLPPPTPVIDRNLTTLCPDDSETNGRMTAPTEKRRKRSVPSPVEGGGCKRRRVHKPSPNSSFMQNLENRIRLLEEANKKLLTEVRSLAEQNQDLREEEYCLMQDLSSRQSSSKISSTYRSTALGFNSVQEHSSTNSKQASSLEQPNYPKQSHEESNLPPSLSHHLNNQMSLSNSSTTRLLLSQTISSYLNRRQPHFPQISSACPPSALFSSASRCQRRLRITIRRHRPHIRRLTCLVSSCSPQPSLTLSLPPQRADLSLSVLPSPNPLLLTSALLPVLAASLQSSHTSRGRTFQISFTLHRAPLDSDVNILR